jgi:hypothetical protein
MVWLQLLTRGPHPGAHVVACGWGTHPGGGGGETTEDDGAVQLPLRQVPAPPVVSVQPVPSGSVPLHLPRLRFVHGGQGFFLPPPL